MAEDAAVTAAAAVEAAVEAEVAVEAEEADWSISLARSKLTEKQVAEKICHAPYCSQKRGAATFADAKEAI